MWSTALERAVRADELGAVRILIEMGESGLGYASDGTTLCALANEHSSGSYQFLRELPELRAHIFPRYVPLSQVYVRANANHKVALLLICIVGGDVLHTLNQLLRHGAGWSNQPLEALEKSVWTALLAFFLPFPLVCTLDDGLAGASASAVCCMLNIEEEMVDMGQFGVSRRCHRVRAATAVHRDGRELSDAVPCALHVVLESVEDADARAYEVLNEALLAMDASLQSATVPLAAPLACSLSQTQCNVKKLAWEVRRAHTLMRACV